MIVIKLDKILESKDMSKYQLHQLTGIRPNTISDMCSQNSKTISLENLNSICKKLNCKLEDLMEYIED